MELVSFLPIIAIAALFYLLIIRPTSKRQREVSRMQSSLSVGDEVMLTSGIFGTIQELADDHVRVLVADGVSLKVVRGAIGTVVHPDPTPEDALDESPDEAAGETSGETSGEHRPVDRPEES